MLSDMILSPIQKKSDTFLDWKSKEVRWIKPVVLGTFLHFQFAVTVYEKDINRYSMIHHIITI